MKLYIVAAGLDYYPGILEDDWIAICPTEEEARAKADEASKSRQRAIDEWYAIVEVDTDTMTYRRVMRNQWGIKG